LLLTAGALITTLSQPRAHYAIGAKPFTEQYVLAALIEQRLRDGGWSAALREGLGSSVIFNALRAGEIDAYVDYSGTIWTNQMHRSDVKPRVEVLAEMAAWLEREHKIKLLGGLGFENAYALACRRPRQRSASAWPSSPPRAEFVDRRRL
jgi:osmoprotectant transport system permease protein